MRVPPLFARSILLTFGVALAVFFCFAPAREFQFLNFDDNGYVTENPLVNSGVRADGIRAAFSDTSTGHWHPLTWISHMLDCEFFGLNPGPHHLVSIMIHALNAGLIFVILLLATGRTGSSIVAALVFGLHPMRIESVVWISERKDVLSMFFGLATILAYLAWVRRGGWWWYLGMMQLFILSLLAKPTFVTLPVLLLILDYWPLKRLSRHAAIDKIPLAVISVILSVIVIYAQRAGQGLRGLSEVGLSDRLVGVFVSYLAYFGKFLVPTGIGIFYPFTTFAPGIGAGALFGFIALSWWFVQARHQRPYLTMGWLWFVVSLLPVIGFVQIGGQIFADRWTYLPHVGLTIALVWLVADQLRTRSRAALACSAIAVLTCFFVTRHYLPYWQNSEALFSHTLEVSPNNFMAHTNLGSALDQAGKLDQASLHYEEAARLNPTYPEALNNLGTLRARQGRLVEAVDLFARAITIRPNFFLAHYNLGLVYSDQGDVLLGLIEWLEALRISPGNIAARQSIEFVLGGKLSLPCEHAMVATTFTSQQRFKEQFSRIGPELTGQEIWSKLAQLEGCF